VNDETDAMLRLARNPVQLPFWDIVIDWVDQ